MQETGSSVSSRRDMAEIVVKAKKKKKIIKKKKKEGKGDEACRSHQPLPSNMAVYEAYVEDKQCHYECNTVFRKSCNVFCAKQKEVNPIKLYFCVINKRFHSTQTYDYQRSFEIFFLIETISARYNILLAQ